MEELYAKFREVMAENAKIKHRNIDLQFEVEELKEELKMRTIPRSSEADKEWFVEKNQELVEENIRLKEELKKHENPGARNESELNETRNRLEENERVLMNEVIIENQKIKDENAKNVVVEKRLEVLTEHNNMLKTKISELEAELDSYKIYCKRLMKVVTGLLGYKIDLKEDSITLLSLYAFDKEDVFVFKQSNDNLQLVTNDFALGWKNEIENYLVRAKSLPAFLSCITLELFNKKTFG